MKNIYFYALLIASALYFTTNNTFAQTATKQINPIEAKPATIANVPIFKTQAEQCAYDRRQKRIATIAQAKAQQLETAQRQNSIYANLLAYEKEQLKNVDITTKEGQLKRMQVQKAFYLQNGDSGTAIKIDAAISINK